MRFFTRRNITVFLLLAMCAVLLCGCGKSNEAENGIDSGFPVLKKIHGGFDAQAYVQGGLDVLYKGEVSEEYLALITDSRGECLEAYEDNIFREAENFCSTFYVGENKEPDAALVELYRAVFAKSRYEVAEAEKTAEGYTVAVTVYPLDIFRESYEALDKFDREFTQRFADGEFAEVAGDAIEREYLAGMLELLSARVDTAGYLEPVTVTVHLDKGRNGTYTVNPDDIALIHNNILPY